MTTALRVVAADDEPGVRDYYRELLPRLGHQVVVADGGRQLVELCRVAEPDLVITDIKMPDMDGLEAAAAVTRDREVPVVLVSAYHDAELRARALQDYVMAYLIKPVKQADLETAIDVAMRRFEQFRTLRREATDLREALEDRKLVERAKGSVMRRLKVSEDEAYRRMRRLASERNRKLAQVARDVIESETLFAALEQ